MQRGSLKMTKFHKNEDGTAEQIIERLRASYRTILNKNNALVQKIWDIQCQLVDLQSRGQLTPEKKEALEQDLHLLTAKSLQENYNAILDDLTTKIYHQEVETYGKSDFGSNSPFSI